MREGVVRGQCGVAVVQAIEPKIFAESAATRQRDNATHLQRAALATASLPKRQADEKLLHDLYRKLMSLC
jgi:hypothetical protein